MVRMTLDGDVLESVRFANDARVLVDQVGKAGHAPSVVLEATYGWYWAVDALRATGASVHLAHPLGCQGFCLPSGEERLRDAADLADLLRMGRLPEAWVASVAVRDRRELVRHRHKLLGLRAPQVCSWAGLTSRHRESDRTVHRGSITKRGCRLVR